MNILISMCRALIIAFTRTTSVGFSVRESHRLEADDRRRHLRMAEKQSLITYPRPHFCVKCRAAKLSSFRSLFCQWQTSQAFVLTIIRCFGSVPSLWVKSWLSTVGLYFVSIFHLYPLPERRPRSWARTAILDRPEGGDFLWRIYSDTWQHKFQCIDLTKHLSDREWQGMSEPGDLILAR